MKMRSTSIVAVATAGAAALGVAWLVRRCRSRSAVRLQEAKLTLIIDCGSGFTRAKCFWRVVGGDVGWSHAADAEGIRWKQARLVDVMSEGGLALREWVQSVQALIESTGAATAIMGATGGLREAVADGRVTPADMQALLAALQELAPTLEFRSLSGDEEARAEFKAVQYVAELGLPPEAPRPIGMLSGGGMTCQLAHYPTGSSSPEFLSIVAAINDATADMRSAAIARDSLAVYRAYLQDQVVATGLKGKLGRSTFVVIEMPGNIGSASAFGGCFRWPSTMEAFKAGFSKAKADAFASDLKLCGSGDSRSLSAHLGAKLLRKDEVAAPLRNHLEEWARATPGPMAKFAPSSYVATQPAELLELLELFDDTARFFLCSSWPTTAGGGEGTISPDWSLGVFLEDV